MSTLEDLRRLTIWRDGELLPPEHAAIPVWDHGVLYGDGVFEGLRLRDGALYRPELHFTRLRRSARAVGIEFGLTDDALLAAIAGTAAANELADAHVRILLTRGVGLPGIDPRRCPSSSLTILVYSFPPLLGEAAISLITSSVVRKSPHSVPAGVKSLNYLDAVLAKLQANEAGAGDALMLDHQGMVAEATGTNVFCIDRGKLRTPPCTSALPGITRATVLELAQAADIEVKVEQLTTGDIYAADEAFLTGTAAGIVPIGSLDGRSLPVAPGAVTRSLDQAYRATWRDPAYAVPLL